MILVKSALRWKFDLSSQALESLHNVTENFTIYQNDQMSAKEKYGVSDLLMTFTILKEYNTNILVR